MGLEDLRQLSLQCGKPEQPGARGEVNKQVHIAVGSVLATGDAAEDPEITRTMTLYSGDQCCPTLTESPAKPGSREPTHAMVTVLKIDRQSDAGRCRK